MQLSQTMNYLKFIISNTAHYLKFSLSQIGRYLKLLSQIAHCLKPLSQTLIISTAHSLSQTLDNFALSQNTHYLNCPIYKNPLSQITWKPAISNHLIFLRFNTRSEQSQHASQEKLPPPRHSF